MLKTLINKQILELFQGYIVDKKTGKARNRSGVIRSFAFLALLFLGLGSTFYMMANGMGIIVLNQGINWLYFALLGLMSMALGVFGSVFSSYASLYLPKDNDTLLAMPIPSRTLLLARTAGVYVSGLMYSAWIWIPTLIAYWRQVPLNFRNVLLPVLLTFVIALFVTVLTCLLGYFVAEAASRIKGKNFLIVVLSLLGITAYYIGYSKVVAYIQEAVAHPGPLTETVRNRLHYLFWLGQAADGDFRAMLLFTLITIALSVLCLRILSRNFLRLAASGMNNAGGAKETVGFASRGLRPALFRRELLHFTALPSWMLNGGLGLVIMCAAAVAALIKREALLSMLSEIAAELPEYAAGLPIFLAAGFCMIIATNLIAPVSISIEGKNLWILQSLPIDMWDVLRAKEEMTVRLNIYPGLISLIVIGTVIGLETPELVLCALVVCAFLLMSTDLGLFWGLKFPNLTWTNVMVPIKRGMPVFFGLFGGFSIVGVFVISGYYLSRALGTSAALAVFAVLFMAGRAVLRRWLKTKGAEILRTL